MHTITTEQKLINTLYKIFGDKDFVINLQVRLNTKKHMKNITLENEKIDGEYKQ